MKPLFVAGEDVAKPGPTINPPNKAGRQIKRQGPKTGNRHDQGSFRSRGRGVHRSRPHRSSGLCPASFRQHAHSARQGRPARYPSRGRGLLAASLAEFRNILPSHSRLQNGGSRSPVDHGRALLIRTFVLRTSKNLRSEAARMPTGGFLRCALTCAAWRTRLVSR